MVKFPKMHSTLKIVWAFFTVGIICLGCQTQTSSLGFDWPTVTPSSPTKQIKSSTLPFVEKWRWSGSIHNLFGPPIIAISKDRVIIATTSQTGKERVVAFDAYTGNQVWESDSKSNLRSLHADDKRVYVGAIRYVWAYDLKTGNLVWEYAEQDITLVSAKK